MAKSLATLQPAVTWKMGKALGDLDDLAKMVSRQTIKSAHLAFSGELC